jgi:hypothetical protein
VGKGDRDVLIQFLKIAFEIIFKILAVGESLRGYGISRQWGRKGY